MQRKKLIVTLCCLMFLSVVMSSFVYADVVVITNNSVKVDQLDSKEIKKIFLGKKKYWDDNQKITLFILKQSETHKEFVRKYLGKSESQFTNYWKQLLFTGKGMMPKRVADEELIEMIKQTEGAIGYMSAGIPTEGVKVVSIKEQ